MDEPLPLADASGRLKPRKPLAPQRRGPVRRDEKLAAAIRSAASEVALGRLPWDVRSKLYSLGRLEIEEWQWPFVVAIEEYALTQSFEGETRNSLRRAFCPLCGGGADSGPYPEKGFALNIGLESHLQGHGNARHCPAMRLLQLVDSDAIRAGAERRF